MKKEMKHHMTKEEKLKILEAAEVRAYEELNNLSGRGLASEDGRSLLHIIDQLRWAQDQMKRPGTCVEGNFPIEPEQVPEPDIAKDEVKPGPVAKAEPAPETPVITKDEVRKRLSVYQTQADLDIAALMQSMGYSKLSEVPADRYMELLERAQETVDGEG